MLACEAGLGCRFLTCPARVDKAVHEKEAVVSSHFFRRRGDTADGAQRCAAAGG